MRVRMPNRKHPKVSLVLNRLGLGVRRACPGRRRNHRGGREPARASPFLCEAFSPAELGLTPETG